MRFGMGMQQSMQFHDENSPAQLGGSIPISFSGFVTMVGFRPLSRLLSLPNGHSDSDASDTVGYVGYANCD